VKLKAFILARSKSQFSIEGCCLGREILSETNEIADAVKTQICGKRSDTALFSPAGSGFISK